MNSDTDLVAIGEIQKHKTWMESLASMFPFISPEFVPVLLLIAAGTFVTQIVKAISLNGFYGVFGDPFSVFWSFVWFVACCAMYTKMIAPHLERTHKNLGMLIHVSCIYTFFSGSLICVQFVIRTIL